MILQHRPEVVTEVSRVETVGGDLVEVEVVVEVEVGGEVVEVVTL